MRAATNIFLVLGLVVFSLSCKEREKKRENTDGAESYYCSQIVNFNTCERRSDCEYRNGRCQNRSTLSNPNNDPWGTQNSNLMCQQYRTMDQCQRNNCSWVNNQCFEMGQGQNVQCFGLAQIQCQQTQGCMWDVTSRTCNQLGIHQGISQCTMYNQTQCQQNTAQCLWDATTLSCRDRFNNSQCHLYQNQTDCNRDPSCIFNNMQCQQRIQSGSGNCAQYGVNRNLCEQDQLCQWRRTWYLLHGWVEECTRIR